MVNTSDILPNTPRYLKVPLIFFNAMLWILGLLLIILGSVVLHELKNVSGSGLDINVGLSSGLIVLGVFILILTVVGSVVAFKEQLVGLVVYTVIMLVLLICLIGVGGGAFSYRNRSDEVIEKAWNTSAPVVRTKLETYFDCCGWGGENYANATIKGGIECVHYVPTNTTIVNTTDPNNGTENVTTWERIVNTDADDCEPTITDYVNNNLYIAGVSGVVIGVIEFVCMFFSLFLIVRLCRNPRSRSYD